MTPHALPPDVPATTDVPLLAGRYQLLDKLGEGGMGAVFRARDGKLDRHVAVKILPVGKLHDAEAVARFQREARALARLCHPGIIQAYDSGEDGDKHFLVMELVEGAPSLPSWPNAAAFPPAAPRTTPTRRRWRFSTPISTALSTATSSRPTCCSRLMGASSCSTWGWPASSRTRSATAR